MSRGRCGYYGKPQSLRVLCVRLACMSVASSARPVRPELLGRSVDLARLVAAPPPGVLLVGEPGIGKTTLWLAAIDVYRSGGATVLSAAPAAVEQAFSYAV